MRSRPGHVQEAPPGPVGEILEGKADGCNRQVCLGSRAALVVPGDGLKRKRIVRTVEVTIETEESVVLRTAKGQQTSLMWCPACCRQVEMVTPEQAAQIASVRTRTIYRWIESGKIHCSEMMHGLLVICADSLHLLS